jgi:hypothetical protein
MKYPYLYLLFLVAFFQCSNKKQVIGQPGVKLFEMSKSPCFGRCPIYTVTIYQNGVMTLMAKDNMTLKGNYTSTMNKSELKDFKSKLKALQIKEFKDEYREPIADAPATTVTYFDGAESKKIFTNFRYPDSLQAFTEQLNDRVTHNSAWTLVEDKTVKQEYLILLKPETKLSDILQRYQDHELNIVRRLDPATSQYWLVIAKVLPENIELFLKTLRSDKDIQSAQTNKPLESR